MTERMVDVGTAAAVVAAVMAVLRYGITAYTGPWPELFVGVIGGIWWGIAGASIALALATYTITLVAYSLPAITTLLSFIKEAVGVER